MCGICGVFFSDRSQRVNRELVTAMNRQIAHRGPDDDGFFVEENVTVPKERRLELEGALAELLLDVAKAGNPGSAEGGSQ